MLRKVSLLLLLLSNACSTSEKHSHYEPKFLMLGEGKRLHFSPGHDMLMHLKPEDLPNAVSLTEIELAPNSLGAPPHVHKNEDEIFIVLSGTVHFLGGETEIVATKGTVASLPRGNFHGFWNPTNEAARMLLLITPGHFEKFFYAVEEAVSKRQAKTPQEIGAIISEMAAQNDVIVDMSKLPSSGLKLLPPPPSSKK